MTPAQKRQRYYSRRIWHHNSLIGKVAFLRGTAQAILDSETTTVEAKAHAVDIAIHTDRLLEELKTRHPDFERARKEPLP